MHPLARCVLQARIGVAIWAVGVAWLRPEWHIALFLLAPLSIVPLGLALADAPGPGGARGVGWRIASWLQLPAAAALIVAHRQEPGVSAGALALPWLAVTGALALHGLARMRRRQLYGTLWRAEELGVDAGLLFVTVGGVWEVAGRLGTGLMGFEGILVQLTAIHFHYAGFALPILAGLQGRLSGGAGRIGRAAAVGTMIGVPMTAIGITWFPAVEVTAALLLAIVGVGLGLAQVAGAIAGAQARPLARIFLAISGLSIVFAMLLAAGWALSTWLQRPWLSIAQMIPTHGFLNALGFSFLGLWARVLARVPPRDIDAAT